MVKLNENSRSKTKNNNRMMEEKKEKQGQTLKISNFVSMEGGQVSFNFIVHFKIKIVSILQTH